MKKSVYTLIAAGILLVLLTSGRPRLGKRYKSFTVMFYNIENMFDTLDTPGKQDEEFLPNGPKQWNGTRYRQKLCNMERVLYDIASENGRYPAVIGIAEVETEAILQEMVQLEKLRRGKYAICHYESPDERGIDAAFLYRPDIFRLQGSRAVKVADPDTPDLRTRDIVTMWGDIDGEPFCFMVAHWPSRLGGQQASEGKRCAAAAIMRHMADSILAARPDTRIVMMGDMNDDPTDRSIAEVLGCKATLGELAAGELYNPYIEMFRNGLGTLVYNGKWNLFDNMVCSENLATGSAGKFRLQKSPEGYHGCIFKRPYMLRKEGYPLRTYAGLEYLNGYSDHLPVYINIVK